MSEQGFQFLQAGAPLNSPGRERVTQVMEVEVHKVGTVHRALPNRAEVVPLARAEHGVGRAIQRHLPPLAAFRDDEQDHTAGAIDSFPGEIEYLTAAQSGEEREFQLDTGTARRRSDLHKLTLPGLIHMLESALVGHDVASSLLRD